MNSNMSFIRDAWMDHWSEPSQRHFDRLVEVYIPLVRRVAEECAAGTGAVEELIPAGVVCLKESIVAFGYDPDRSFMEWFRERLELAVRARMVGQPRRGVATVSEREFDCLCRELPAALAGRATVDPRASAPAGLGRAARGTTLTPGQRDRLRAFIFNSLNRSDRLILVYFGQSMTARETAIMLHLSESRVKRMLNTTLERLRAALDEAGPGGAGVGAKLPPTRPGGAGRAGDDGLMSWV